MLLASDKFEEKNIFEESDVDTFLDSLRSTSLFSDIIDLINIYGYYYQIYFKRLQSKLALRTFNWMKKDDSIRHGAGGFGNNDDIPLAGILSDCNSFNVNFSDVFDLDSDNEISILQSN